MRIAPHLTLLAGLAGCFQSAGLGLDGNAQDSICPPGQTLCRGVCVDLETDTENCGMCGYACEAGHNCSGGICRAECEDMCGSAMAHRCSSDRAGVEICGDYDLDGCLEWSDPIPCPSGTACVGGDCRGSELVCGDGIVEAPEECDDGEGNSDAIPDACRTDCRLAYCGDGVCDSSEHCTGCPSDCGECYDLCHPENYNGHDYLFCLSEVAWQDALDLCAGAGFHLITVNDYPEQFWASNAALDLAHVPQIPTWPNAGWWIGYNDIGEEGLFTWQDGSSDDFTYWCGPEPSNNHGRECVPEDEEDCAILNYYNDGCWNDLPCSCARLYFICEAG